MFNYWKWGSAMPWAMFLSYCSYLFLIPHIRSLIFKFVFLIQFLQKYSNLIRFLWYFHFHICYRNFIWSIETCNEIIFHIYYWISSLFKFRANVDGFFDFVIFFKCHITIEWSSKVCLHFVLITHSLEFLKPFTLEIKISFFCAVCYWNFKI